MRTRYNKRIDRANRTRSALARKARGRLRLSIFRSPKHIYAQVIDDVRGVTLAAASTIDKSLKDDVVCVREQHTNYRSVLGQINWLQSRTQFQSCYLFSRCASACANPTIGDCRALNKLVRRIRQEVVVLRFWPLGDREFSSLCLLSK